VSKRLTTSPLSDNKGETLTALFTVKLTHYR
jgi:hypothetical protein